MRGVYTAEINIADRTDAGTLIMLEVPSDMVIEILSAHVTNEDNDTSEQIEIELCRITAKGSAAGTSITPEKHENGDVASTVTATGNLTTEPDTYATIAFDHQGVQNLAGYHYEPQPEERPIISPSGFVGLNLVGAITSSDIVAQIVFREIGG